MAAFHSLANANFACPEGLQWGEGAKPSAVVAQQAVITTRRAICEACEEYDAISGKCGYPEKKCRCCPLKKW
jgi:hypothetical protein